jgi:hypothetical protein
MKGMSVKLDAAGRFSALVLSAIAVAVACSGSDDARRKSKAAPDNPFAEYSVKIRAGKDAKEYNLPPLKETSFYIPHSRLLAKVSGGAEPRPGVVTPKQPPSKSQVTIETPEGGVVIDDDLGTARGWGLVYGAAYECGFGSQPSLTDYPVGQDPVIPPWSNNAFFIFEQDPAACDPQVAYQETMLCIADKLSEIADTPASLTWSKVPSSPTAAGMPPGPWTIPPQASIDRFIARDVAMHALAIIGFTDLIAYDSPPGADSPTRTCARAYGEAAALTTANPPPSQSVRDNYFETVFGVPNETAAPYFPSVGDGEVKLENFADLARVRMLFNAHVLRAAARLMRDQIPKAVYADLAGGEQQRARATDPLRGAKLMWGEESDADQPYNSLAHVARVLTGRWERGDLEGDPECGSIPPLNLMKEALGPEYSARYGDRPVTTKGQEVAAKLVDQAGVVLPESTILTGSITTIRGAVLDQLIANTAAIHNVSPTDADFNEWGEGRAVSEMFGLIADEDLRFGLLRASHAYRQLASSLGPGGRTPTDPGGGMKATETVSSVDGLDGLSIDGGIPRRDLTTPIAARVGGLQIANQCSEPDDMNSAILADGGALAAFQDAFYVGETFKKRLVALREEAALVFDESEDVVKVPAVAAVEVRSWAGEGRITLGTDEASGEVNHFTVGLIGFNPEDFAVTDASDIEDEIVLAYGPPWVGDCAARLRTSCPEDFDDDYLARPDSATVITDTDPSDPPYNFDRSWARMSGADGVIVMLTFDSSSFPAEFEPDIIANTTPTNKLYVVARHATHASAAKGRVLAALAPRGDGITTAMSNEFQQNFFHDATAIPSMYPEYSFTPHGPTSATPPAFCIEGVKRKPFVPLENEITSDADPYENSWRHYLELAKQAAARADGLGREMIELGLQKDLRREAAGEELAALCGDYAALDEITINTPDGKINKSKTDKALNSCLSEDRRDVVFLTDPPPELLALGAEEPDVTDWLKEFVLRCQTSTTAAENPLCDATTVSYGDLGLSPYSGIATPDTAQCEKAIQVVQSLKSTTGLDAWKMYDVSSGTWVSQPSLLAGLSQLQIRVEADAEWAAFVGGTKVMSTTDEALWPNCLDSSTQHCDYTVQPVSGANPLSVQFDRIFRGDNWTIDPGLSSAKMAFLWRVQGAAWMLGGLAGQVPGGTFQGFVPAAKLKADNSANYPPNDQVPDATLYAHSNYFSTGGNWSLAASNWNGYGLSDAERALVGNVANVPSTFDFSESHAPSYIKYIYESAAGLYLHVPASSTLYRSSDYYNNSYFIDPTKIQFAPPADIPYLNGAAVADWLVQRAGEFQGIKCPNFTETATNPAAPQTEGWRWTGTLKFSGWLCGNKWSTDTNPKVMKGASFRMGFPFEKNEFPPPISTVGVNYDYPLTPNCTDGFLLGQPSMRWVDAPCAADPQATWETYRWNPSNCTPSERMTLFVNSQPPATSCTAAAELTQAVALGCILSRQGVLPVPTSPPGILTIEDLPKLESWVGEMEKFASTALSRLFLQGVPQRVIDDFKSGSVGTGSLKGKHGQLILELESANQGISNGWFQLAGTLAKIRAAIQGARLKLELDELEQKVDAQQLVIQRWQVHSKIAHAIANAISSFGFEASFNPIGNAAQTAAAGIDLEIAQAELSAIGNIEALQGAIKDTQVEVTLNALESGTLTLYGEAYTALTALRQSTLAAAQASEALKGTELSAQYFAAKGAGVDFLKIDGDTVLYPVNSVLNRQYYGTKLRYESALLEARYLAYVARIAIEQRIGLGLETFTDDIGPLEAPSKWAADVCLATGVDYEQLQEPIIPIDGSPLNAEDLTEKAAQEYADMFIGDYVDKLEKFVEFYNMEYPSHDGDDIAVLSLRDELLKDGSICTLPSPNLLLYSSELTAGHMALDSAGSPAPRGWLVRHCTSADEYCLFADSGTNLNPVPETPDGSTGSVTWLHDVEVSSITDLALLDEIANTVEPARVVYQPVHLEPGKYVVSWWDQARDADGELAPSAGYEYALSVVDEQSKVIDSKLYVPHIATQTQPWSERRKVGFVIGSAGTYHIAFASNTKSSELSSFAIANVQLELGTVAGPYWAVGSSSLVLDTQCAKGDVASLQAAFEYICDQPEHCYYQLKAPFSIDTFALQNGTNLSGKVAANNFNYRHITVGLNLVGSGVVDCALEGTAACYGSAYTEYTLDHFGFDVPVLSHLMPEIPQKFNFGLGTINHAKALAAERFITLPIGSADGALLSQPAFEKTEFRGRPLDGTYRLRIHDKPSLRWDHVEDVQFILNYRYWSRIQPFPSTQ